MIQIWSCWIESNRRNTYVLHAASHLNSNRFKPKQIVFQFKILNSRKTSHLLSFWKMYMFYTWNHSLIPYNEFQSNWKMQRKSTDTYWNWFEVRDYFRFVWARLQVYTAYIETTLNHSEWVEVNISSRKYRLKSFTFSCEIQADVCEKPDFQLEICSQRVNPYSGRIVLPHAMYVYMLIFQSFVVANETHLQQKSRNRCKSKNYFSKMVYVTRKKLSTILTLLNSLK